MSKRSYWKPIADVFFGLLLVLACSLASAGAGINSGAWTALGPDQLGGRISTIAIHPTQLNKMWVGSPGGGIWKSTDSGASWSPVNDFLPSLVITSIVIDPGNANVMYAGTGEQIPFYDSTYRREARTGAGILKSVDGGITWAALPSTNPAGNAAWSYVHKVAVHPTNGSILLATNSGGVWRSADAGGTWTLVLAQVVNEVQFDPLDGNKALSAGRAKPWYSTDAGLTWTESATFALRDQASSMVAYSRQPGVVYAVTDHSGAGSPARFTYRSNDGGINWSTISAPGYMGPRWILFDNSIWVDPTDSNHVILGSQELYRTIDGGANWTQISSSTQAASVSRGQRVIVSSPGYDGTSNRTIFVGSHGGLYRATDIQAVTATNVGWTSLNNGLAITQFYSGTGHAGTNGRIIGGTQGSGPVVYAGSGTTWSPFASNEGAGTAIDPTDGNIIYGGAPRNNVYRSMTGGTPSTFISGTVYFDTTSSITAPPLAIDPNNPNTMWLGGYTLYRSVDVRSATPTWSSLSFPDAFRVNAIAFAPGSSDVIWLGLDTTTVRSVTPVQKTTNGSAAAPNWIRMGSGILPAGRARALLIDKDNANLVYVSIGTQLWRTVDGGTSWTQINGNLKPFHTLVRHPTLPNYLYAGTDVGIFTSENGGINWSSANDAPANVRVDELFWIGNTLYAATHGRGMFKTVATITTHSLTIAKAGTGSGPVTGSPAGIACGSACSATFAQGTAVTLTATPNAGSAFAGWSGACSGTGTCTVTMNAATNVTATFNAGTHQNLTVFKSGTGSGPVTSNPSGIVCGSDCSNTYPYGTTVTLTASPNAGSVFAGWSGACTGTASTCIVSMVAQRDVTATFNQAPVLTVGKAGTGSGPVTSNPSGISCGSLCSKTFSPGATVTLTATPNSGSVFAGWSGDCSGTSSTCVVTMNGARNVTATFHLMRALTVAKAGSGSGTLTSNPAGINCGATCSANFIHGTNVTLTASSSAGSHFTGWSAGCSSSTVALSGGTCLVAMSAARQITATFVSIVVPLVDALDNPALSWTTSGSVPWFGQTVISFDGVDAAESGGLGPNQDSILSTTVTGPGTLTFRWRVQSQQGFDLLTFYIDGAPQAGAISGDSGWLLQTWNISAGSHVLHWRYAKDGSISISGDRGFVDQVQFTPSSGSALKR